MPAPVSVDHLAFPTRNLDATDDFYSRVMKARLVGAHSRYSPSRRCDYLLVTFALPDGTRLSFVDWPTDAGRDADHPDAPDDVFHIGLRCDTPRDVIAWQNHLFQHRVVYHSEDDGTSRRLFIRDPNGIRFEIFASSMAGASHDHEGQAREAYRNWQNARQG